MKLSAKCRVIHSKQKKNTANADGKKYYISFKCHITIAQAKALKEYCKENGIVIEEI